MMGPRLAPVSGAGPGAPAPCHVLDAKYEPGVRAVLLYEQDGRLLRGDLVDGGDAMATTGATVVEPGSCCPHDPELPALPRVMDPAQLGPALVRGRGGAWGRLDARQASRCRITLLRYRPASAPRCS